MEGLKTWRLGDVIVAHRSAGSLSADAWRTFREELRRAHDEALKVPFVRVIVLVTATADPLIARLRDEPSGGGAIPAVVVGEADECDDLVSVLAASGLNARHYEMTQALEALRWLAIDGQRARAIIRELSREDATTEAPAPLVAALKECAATPGTLAVDAERFRIARDLHDGVCASLAGLRMRLGVLASLHADAELREELDALGTTLEGVLEEVRTIAWGMRVGDPTWQQLASHLAKRVQEISGRRVDVALDADRVANRVPRAVALRVITDARNGAASIGALAMEICVEATPERIRLELKAGDAAWSTLIR